MINHHGFMGFDEDGCAVFAVPVDLARIYLRRDDAGNMARLYAPDPIELPVSDLSWEALEQEGANVPVNEHRVAPFQGPPVFCQTPTGKRDAHGAYVIAGERDADMRYFSTCAFCKRSVWASPAHPERTHHEPLPKMRAKRKPKGA